MVLTCEGIKEQLGPLWGRVVQPPFIKGCVDGSITEAQFHTWLIQDYHYVVAFTRFTGQILAEAPVEHLDALLSGLSALSGELRWFREKVAERKLHLAATPVHATNARYIALLRSLWGQAYHVLAPCLWAIEISYGLGWQMCGQVAEPYREFAERWGNPEFMEYASVLEMQANAALAATDQAGSAKALEAVRHIFEQEEAFWAMAMDGPVN